MWGNATAFWCKSHLFSSAFGTWTTMIIFFWSDVSYHFISKQKSDITFHLNIWTNEASRFTEKRIIFTINTRRYWGIFLSKNIAIQFINPQSILCTTCMFPTWTYSTHWNYYQTSPATFLFHSHGDSLALPETTTIWKDQDAFPSEVGTPDPLTRSSLQPDFIQSSGSGWEVIRLWCCKVYSWISFLYKKIAYKKIEEGNASVKGEIVTCKYAKSCVCILQLHTIHFQGYHCFPKFEASSSWEGGLAV